MDELRVSRIKIRVLLSRSSYLRRREKRERRVFLRRPICANGVLLLESLLGQYASVNKKPFFSQFVALRGIRHCSIRRETENSPLLFLTLSLASTSGE